MTDYPKHEWSELNEFNWRSESIDLSNNISNEEIRYQAFKARLIKELVAENAAGNTNAELQADAGRSTRHSEHCKARFNSARINSGYMDYPCTCDLPPQLVDSAL